QGYWRDVGTVQSYHAAHMDLLESHPQLNLEDPDLKLRTAGPIQLPAKFARGSRVNESLISPGTHIAGEVTRSVISPGVIIEEGAVVRDAIIQHKCVIRSGAVIDHAILDKEVTVGRDCVIGEGDMTIVNQERPDIVNAGITIVGKR